MTPRAGSMSSGHHRLLSPGSPSAAAVQAFLTGYVVTLTPLVAGFVALQIGSIRLGAASWPSTGAALASWCLAVAVWLHHRRWPTGTVDVVMLAPVIVLAGPLSFGWLSPGGLLIWGPMSTLLTVALALSGRPLELDRER